MPDPKRLLILTGDHSADMHAATVARALRQIDPAWQISGVGAAAMRDAGVELISDHTHMNVLGPGGVLAAIPSHRRLARKILAWVDEHRPRVAMLVDYGMFHLWLGPKLRQRGVKVIYFIPPQIWASRPGRIKKLRRAADQVLCILPFEEEYYRSRGMPAQFVGNPLASHLPPPASRESFAQRHGMDPNKTWIGLFPGSRRLELRHLLRPQLEAAQILDQRFPGRFEFALARATNLSEPFFQQAWAKASHGLSLTPRILVGENHASLSVVDLALLASGTVTLEAALYGTPMVIMYKGSLPVYLLARAMIQVPHIGMPNLLAGRRIVPELWQYEVTGERIAASALEMLEPSRLNQAQQSLSELRVSFKDMDPPAEVADAVVRQERAAG